LGEAKIFRDVETTEPGLNFAGKLTAVDGDTCMPLYTSTDTCSGVRRWTSPIVIKGRIVVGGDTHLCSWSAL